MLFALSMGAQASTVIFTSSPSLTNVNVEARITLDATNQTILIQLMNHLSNPSSVTQLISGFAFSLSNVTPSSGTLASKSGAYDVSVASGGSWTGPTVDSSPSWILQSITSGQVTGVSNPSFFLCEICVGGGAPKDLIIGGPNPATNKYDAAGGSIAGNGPHNPFLLGTGGIYTPTFVINVSGLTPITAQTKVTQVTFLLGTSLGAAPDLGVPSVPEPATAGIMLAGLALIGIRARARPKNKA